MQKMLGIKLSGDPVKAVEVLANRYTLNEVERGRRASPPHRRSRSLRYGLINAVTPRSHKVDDYDRATEFEAMGGKLIELPTGELKAPVVRITAHAASTCAHSGPTHSRCCPRSTQNLALVR
jgi:hypothetical protein